MGEYIQMRDYVRRIYLNHWKSLEAKRDDFGECVRKMDEFRATHKKIVDTSVYTWFNEWALPVLKIYIFSTKGEIDYDIGESMISVRVKFKEKEVLLCSPYDDILEMLKLASSTWITLDKDNMIVLEMTFNTFHWEEK